MHGVKEPSNSIEGNWRRKDGDKEMCLRIFKTVRIRNKNRHKILQESGPKEQRIQPDQWLLSCTAKKKEDILEKAKDLQNTTYSDVNIVPDLTKKQRSEENKMQEEADNRNKDLTREEREKT